MLKPQVIEAFCRISTKVMTEQFSCKHSADCFCFHSNREPQPSRSFSFSREVIDFIEQAVNEKLERDKPNKTL